MLGNNTLPTQPIVWTIAASDSGGGAGIQADLKTFFDLGLHGCSAITALSAQNTQGVIAVEASSRPILQQQLFALSNDLPPSAIKIGVLPNYDSIELVKQTLQQHPCPSILDTVLSPTLGDSFTTSSTQDALINLFKYTSLITPNIPEAQQLTGITIHNADTQQQAAEALLAMGANAVLLKGGHGVTSQCQDYFVSANHTFWLTQNTLDTLHNHGTGCTLSSAITAFIAQGKALHDAVVLANAYINKGLTLATSHTHNTQQKGAVTQTGWPDNFTHFPQISTQANAVDLAPMPTTGSSKLGLYPVVDSIEWLEKLLSINVKTIQLRVKNIPEAQLELIIEQAAKLGQQYHARLFINDYWELAIKYKAYGIHLGQEDMAEADIDAIRAAGLRLGISTHSEYEFCYAATFKPSYLAIGAIFPTDTKEVVEVGLDNLYCWSQILNPHYPLVAIGGINQDNIQQVLHSNIGSVAVVSAITQADNYQKATQALNHFLL